jgi:hypothetical protein
MPSWWREEIVEAEAVLGMKRLATGDADYPVSVVSLEDAPITLDALSLRNPSIGPGELNALIAAIESAVSRQQGAWGSAVFVPNRDFLLLTSEAAGENRRAVLTGLMSGGAKEISLAPSRIRAINPWLTEGEIVGALRRLKLASGAPPSPRRAKPLPPEAFHLPGQPETESLLRDRVLDVLHRPEAYTPLGVKLPNGILLSGPPGAGKSFAARRLAFFLDWPLFELNVGNVGSSLLHETPKRITEVFEKAAADAPAMVLLEEVDAIARSRDTTHSAGVEEVNTLLRAIESAAERGLLVVATTNRKPALDTAFLRRGRFDVICELGYPDAAHAQAMLDSLLGERPCILGLNTSALAGRLAGRPASDIAAVVEECERDNWGDGGPPDPAASNRLSPMGAAGCLEHLAVQAQTDVVAIYRGTYTCVQGPTEMTLTVQRIPASLQARASFKFGPTCERPKVPFGSFRLERRFDTSGGMVSLIPTAWIERPADFQMVGLEGVNTNQGATSWGNITGGINCTTFQLQGAALSDACR